jgi:hypothetical protein
MKLLERFFIIDCIQYSLPHKMKYVSIVFAAELIITGRQSRQSGGGGATCPDFRSHPAW